MAKHLAIKGSDFCTFKGRLGRLDFLFGILLTGSLVTVLYFMFRNYVLGLGDSFYFFGFISFLQLLALSLATPIYVKRFHDLNSPGYWVLIYWVCLPFTFETAYLIEFTTGVQINPFNEFIIFTGIIGLLVLAVLFLKKGNPDENEWGNPSKRMQ